MKNLIQILMNGDGSFLSDEEMKSLRGGTDDNSGPGGGFGPQCNPNEECRLTCHSYNGIKYDCFPKWQWCGSAAANLCDPGGGNPYSYYECECPPY